MPRILISYTTLFGHTAQMAERVAEGARSVSGADVDLKAGDDLGQDDVLACDALVLGAAIHMATADAHMKRVVEEVLYQLWLVDAAVGKVGAVFTVGGGYGSVGGGAELGQLGLLASLAECGMLLVPFPKTTPGSPVAGTFWGPHGRTGGLRMEPQDLTEDMLTAAFHHGANVARVAGAVAGHDLLATGNQAPVGDVLEAFQQAGKRG
jgi:NAD(P)H dehydrogenase (quinone)